MTTISLQERALARLRAVRNAQESCPRETPPVHTRPASTPRAISARTRAPRRISRITGAERIAKALRRAGFATDLHYDREHPGEAIHLHATRTTGPRTHGVVVVHYDGRLGLDLDFGFDPMLGRTINTLLDVALSGCTLDPGKDPPPERRMEIAPWEAAWDIAVWIDKQRRLMGDDPRGLDVEIVQPRTNEQERTLVLRRTFGGRDEIGRLVVRSDGRLELSEDMPPEVGVRVLDLAHHALAGRRIVAPKQEPNREGSARS